MEMKNGTGWKACRNEAEGICGAEVVLQGSWELYEISTEVFDALNSRMRSSDAEKLIRSGRRLYKHVNDRCGPPYTVVLDENYARWCPWAAPQASDANAWNAALTKAASALFAPEDP